MEVLIQTAEKGARMQPEPDFLAQTGETSTVDQRRSWIEERTGEARAKGMTHGRASYDEEHNLLLVEFWKIRPADEGEPRFQFSAVDGETKRDA